MVNPLGKIWKIRLRRRFRGHAVKSCRVVAAPISENRGVTVRGRLRAASILFFALLWIAPAARSDVQIAGLSDLNLGTWGGAGDLTGDIGHCVLNTVPPAKFSIDVSGDGAGGAFALINGVSSLPMQLSYNDGGGFVSLTPNTPLTNQKGQNSTKFTKCMNGTGAQLLIRVLVLGTDMSLANGGSYSGTIYLNVVPQ